MPRILLIVVFGMAVCVTAVVAMNKDYFLGPRPIAKGVKKPSPQAEPDHSSIPGDCPGCPLPSN